MKILLVLITLLFSTQVEAKQSIEELQAKYKSSVDGVSDDKKIFIPENTINCGSRAKLTNLANQAINSGGTVKLGSIRANGCERMEGWSIGLVAEYDQAKDMVWLFYTIPRSGGNVGWGWFKRDHLMTVEARKAMIVK